MFTPLSYELIPRATEQEAKLTIPKFYRLDWSAYPKHCEEFDPDENPSFQKMMQDPNKSTGIWKGLIRSLVGSADNAILKKERVDMFNIDSIFKNRIRSVMMWCPQGAGIKKDNLNQLSEVLKSILVDWLVVPINSDVTSNENVERMILDEKLPEAEDSGKRGVWILSSGMGARSFSVPDIDLTILAYDKGLVNTTIQKMFRALTSGKNKQFGHILSLSIDGNRDQKFADMISDTAIKMQNSNNKSFNENLSEVLRTLNFFDIVKDGKLVQIFADTYCEKILEATSISRMCYNQRFDIFADREILDIVSKITPSTKKQNRIPVNLLLGKTKDQSPTTKGNFSKEKKKIEEDFREKLRSIAENMCVLSVASATSDLNEAISVFKNDEQMNSEFLELFGIDIYDFEKLLKKGIYNSKILQTAMIVSFNKYQNSIK
jgi:hypothetical protein